MSIKPYKQVLNCQIAKNILFPAQTWFQIKRERYKCSQGYGVFKYPGTEAVKQKIVSVALGSNTPCDIIKG